MKYDIYYKNTFYNFSSNRNISINNPAPDLSYFKAHRSCKYQLTVANCSTLSTSILISAECKTSEILPEKSHST